MDNVLGDRPGPAPDGDARERHEERCSEYAHVPHEKEECEDRVAHDANPVIRPLFGDALDQHTGCCV
jgi:hypothetical protein